jgi:O-antigen/teichoic acid export membrane protein
MPSGELPSQAESLGVVVDADVLDTPDAGPAAIRGGILRTAAYAGGIVLTLASAPLLIRHLGVVRFGQFMTVVSLIAIVTGLTEGGLNAVALREYAILKGRERDRVLANLLGVRLMLSAVGVAVAVVFAAIAGYPGSLVLGTVLAGLGMVFQLSQSFCAVPLQGTLRFGWVAAIEFGRQVVTVVLIVALVVAGAGVVGFLAIFIPAGLASMALTAVVARRLMPLRPQFDVGVWLPLLRDTFPYAVAIALNSLYLRLTIVVMSLIATDLHTGVFATSFRIVEVLIGVPALVISAAFPILSRAVRDDMDRFAYASRRLFELSVLVGAWMVLCVELGARFAVDVLTAEHQAAIADVLRIQGFAIVATFVAVACGFPLLSLRRYRELLYANAAALVASLVLTLVLVPSFDAEGAALAAVGAELALAATTAALLVRSGHGVRLPLSVIPVAIIAFGAAMIGSKVLGGHAVIQVAVGSLLYVLALIAQRRFPPEVRDAFFSRTTAQPPAHG